MPAGGAAKFSYLVACAIAAFALAGLVAPVAAAEDRALVVVIDNYADTKIADLPSKLADNDAAAVEKILTGKLGFKKKQIRILKNEQATREAILKAFQTWLNPDHPDIEKSKPRSLIGLEESGALNKTNNKKKPNKSAKKKKRKWQPPPKTYRSYFYFAGLGSTEADANGDEKDGRDETLVPYDAKLEEQTMGLTGGISDDEIDAALKQFKYRNVTLVLDTSHSGIVTRKLNLQEKSAVRMRVASAEHSARSVESDGWLSLHKQEGPFASAKVPGGSLEVWSAASATQTALIAGPDAVPNGLFTLLYVEGLESGKADFNGNGIISNAELLHHVKQGSRLYCKAFTERCEMGLTPRLDPAEAYARSAWVDRKKVKRRKERSLSFDRLKDFLAGYKDGELEIAQTPASPVHVGTTGIRYEVTTSQPGRLVLLNLTEDGSLFQLYPHPYRGAGAQARLSLVKAGTPLRVPEVSYGVTLSATEAGKGHIVALMTPDDVKFDKSVTSRVIASVSSDEAIGHYLARLSAALHRPVHQGAPESNTGSASWFMKSLLYEVLPKKLPKPSN